LPLDLGRIKNIRFEVLAEVNYAVLEDPSAGWIIALAAGLVVVYRLSRPCSEVSHVVLAALLADFEVGVAVELTDLVGGDPTLPVKPINILRHNEFEKVLLHQSHHRHVAPRRESSREGRAEGGLGSRLMLQSSFFPRL